MAAHDPEHRPHEQGQISVFILGLAVIAAVVAFGAAAVTSAHISRMQLLDAADAAALDAADAGAEAAYGEGLGRALPLSDAVVVQTANTYLAGRTRPARMREWGVAPGTGAPDGATAVVRLTGVAELPFVGGMLDGLGGTVTITVESRARTVIAGP
ncbi:pilus assembly protein TadG-related protein [Kribbia dieselivorans]|uniref:pilus assembly protein TadG-related protein n=1 Tax=Kribbia dieselivorans TaxID=331526 RepID=UPI0008399B6A|nr:pilus assembly protein TadG-related protein [Kribbia dieselivorans]